MHLRIWPNFFFMVAIVSGICGFTGLAIAPEQAEFARALFCISAAALVPFSVMKLRFLFKERHG